MTKIDLKKTLDCYSARRNEFRIVHVPTMMYLMVDGEGDPNTSPEWQQALQALYTLAYSLKFLSKYELDRDYVVMPLEGLWWSSNMDSFTTSRNKAEWSWTAMIMVPEWTTSQMFATAKANVSRKNPDHDFSLVRMETLAEGLCVQTLHVGSYDDEGPILQEMHNSFIPQHNLALTGKHHEIYLGDARRVAPEKLRTILRQPVIQR